ncbi:MAG: Gfo/Idh/MocA family oxidoreductase [Saprospirales bacterium]|nr:Gfo/Idh/MocA family oxidoreductase [Saprospirales bacterium]
MPLFNIALIGYGGFGKFLHHHWSQLENARVVAVADEDAQKMQGLSPEIRTYTDWRRLLEDKDIDLVAIVTVPNSHEMIASACMKAGKHVLIEKPLATTLSDAQKIVRTRDRTHAVAGIDFMMRFNPLIRELQQFTHLEMFGKLRRVDVENYAQDEQLPPEHWFWDRSISGGILVEHGVHFIDLVHFLSPAKIVEVNGLKHERNARQEDQVMANVLYEGGLIATHYHAFSRPGFFEATKIKLAYDLADIEMHGWMPLWADVKALVNAETRQSMLSSPLFKMTDSIPVEQAFDESRPKGWGISGGNGENTRHSVRSGGIPYDVDELLTGRLDIGRSKQEVYGSCVQASLLDVLKKIQDPGHELTAPLEAGLESLEIALRASAPAKEREV